MNVALTRAKEALFVIGSPAVLMGDEQWTHWLRFCWRNGLVSKNHDQWTGPKPWNSRTPPAAWKGPGDGVGEEKIGVLERALVAKEERAIKINRVLGAGAASRVANGDYELWTESLRNALDEDEDQERGIPDDAEDDTQDDTQDDIQDDTQDDIDIQGAVQDHIGKANDDNGAHNHTTTSPASDEIPQQPDRVRDFYGDV
jgi:helicase MOV-10